MKKILIACSAAFVLPVAAHAAQLEGKQSSADIIAASTKEDWKALDPENTLYIELEKRRVVIALSPSLAPKHVANIKKLARAGFYNGLTFYRVIDGFVAQGGDALETRSKELPTLAAEFETATPKEFSFYEMKDRDGYAPRVGFIDGLPIGYDPKTRGAWHLHCPGALAMARGDEPDTAKGEFYISLQQTRYLDRNMTVLGRVVAGMEHVQSLRRVAPPEKPEDDLGEKIIMVRVAADVPEAERTNLEMLSTDSPAFDAYVESRRNRPEPFFVYRPGFVDICQLSVPVRPVSAE